MDKAKPFVIPKQTVWRAYERVKANRGSAGIDDQTIEEFEKSLKGNLFKLWNRMSSGSYMPRPVKTVAIPKQDGGKRKLGIPTVTDRIAQMVVKMELEPILDPIFHEDSYGYRPGKSAHQAVEAAKQRCWRNSWVIDLDIKGFFDTINHDLLMRAVRKHTSCTWVLLYIERWLKAGVIEEDGKFRSTVLGTPQGGVISPLLANLFLHYVFDAWMSKAFPEVKFERFADDIIVHCRGFAAAKALLKAITVRMNECGLTLHPEKTKIVFCKNQLKYKPVQVKEGCPQQFDFLGFTFMQRTTQGPDGKLFDGFLPAISKSSRKRITRQMRQWGVNRASDLSLEQISKLYNPAMRGWANYFGKFRPQALKPLRQQWHHALTQWALRKYKRFGEHKTNAGRWIYGIECRDPKLFALWGVIHGSK